MGCVPTVMSVGSLVLVFKSIVDTVPLLRLVTKAVLPSGVTATSFGFTPTGMSVGFLVLVFRSIVDTVLPALLATTAVLPSGVIASPTEPKPTAISVGSLVLVLTSIADTVPKLPGVGSLRDVKGPKLVTKTVLPSGVTTASLGNGPTGMSSGSFVPVLTSIVETVPLPRLVTKAVLPSGVTATWTGSAPTEMSAGFLVLVLTSIIDTVPTIPGGSSRRASTASEKEVKGP